MGNVRYSDIGVTSYAHTSVPRKQPHDPHDKRGVRTLLRYVPELQGKLLWSRCIEREIRWEADE